MLFDKNDIVSNLNKKCVILKAYWIKIQLKNYSLEKESKYENNPIRKVKRDWF